MLLRCGRGLGRRATPARSATLRCAGARAPSDPTQRPTSKLTTLSRAAGPRLARAHRMAGHVLSAAALVREYETQVGLTSWHQPGVNPDGIRSLPRHGPPPRGLVNSLRRQQTAIGFGPGAARVTTFSTSSSRPCGPGRAAKQPARGNGPPCCADGRAAQWPAAGAAARGRPCIRAGGRPWGSAPHPGPHLRAPAQGWAMRGWGRRRPPRHGHPTGYAAAARTTSSSSYLATEPLWRSRPQRRRDKPARADESASVATIAWRRSRALRVHERRRRGQGHREKAIASNW
jgi:hypothetical protein